MRKRTASAESPNSPPQKLLRRISDLQIKEPPLISDEMPGIESPDFYHVSENDWLEALKEVEIDDRFLKIPPQIVNSYFERPSNALIPYKPPLKGENNGSSQNTDEGRSAYMYNTDDSDDMMA